MTDQRTLKRIVGEQRGIIEKQKLVIEELNENYLKLNKSFEESDNLLGKANDELTQYKEENYDNLYTIAFLKEDLEDLRTAIKQRYAILKEQKICIDCFKDVPLLASLCVDSTKVKNMSEGELYNRIRNLDKAWQETFDHTIIKKILDEAKAEHFAIIKGADDEIDEAKAKYGDIDYDWIKDVYQLRDANIAEWFCKWFGYVSSDANQKSSEVSK
jgi:hypothetical protein